LLLLTVYGKRSGTGLDRLPCFENPNALVKARESCLGILQVQDGSTEMGDLPGAEHYLSALLDKALMIIGGHAEKITTLDVR
jgi:hypothetical protein